MVDSCPFEDLVFTIDIKAPRQAVWDEITKTGRVQLAMHNTVLESELAAGSKLRYYSVNRKRVLVVGEIIEIVPPEKLSHTFKFTMREEKLSTVTWYLEDIPDGCRVTVIHSGWTDQIDTYKGVVKGWNEILGLLKCELETGTIPTRVKVRYAILKTLMFLLPKSTKVEEVEKAGW